VLHLTAVRPWSSCCLGLEDTQTCVLCVMRRESCPERDYFPPRRRRLIETADVRPGAGKPPRSSFKYDTVNQYIHTLRVDTTSVTNIYIYIYELQCNVTGTLSSSEIVFEIHFTRFCVIYYVKITIISIVGRSVKFMITCSPFLFFFYLFIFSLDNGKAFL